MGEDRGENPTIGAALRRAQEEALRRPQNQCALRRTATDALRARAAQLHRRAAAMESLAAALPAELHRLSPEADAALWELLTGGRG